MTPARAIALAALSLALGGAGAWWIGGGRGAEGDEAHADLVASQLAALGYVETVSDELDPSRRGVVLHDAARAWPGVNVYCSVHGDRAHFLDMDGRELHSIALPQQGHGSDCMLEPVGERSFLALSWPALTLLDWDARVAWTSLKGHHHDLSLDAAGRVWSLLQQGGILRTRGRRLPIVEHTLARLGPGGEVELRIPLTELFAGAVPEERLARMEGLLRTSGRRSTAYAKASDVFHFNGVEVLDRDLTVARRGHVLLCARELDLIAIVDPETRSLIWSFGPGELDRPHHPSVLPNGHLLVFDNGKERGWSRVLELEPETGRIVWEHRGDPPESFWSASRGSAEALPNGNVLVTESGRGRVFEVTREGAIVWAFLNPEFEAKGRRQIYRMQRVPLERYAGWVASARSAAR